MKFFLTVLLGLLSSSTWADAPTWDLHRRRGYWFEQRNRLEEALHEYRQAIALNSTCPDCKLRQAACYYRLGHRKEALRHLKSYLALRPDDATAAAFEKRIQDELEKTTKHLQWRIGFAGGAVILDAVPDHYARPYQAGPVPGGVASHFGMELQWRPGKRWILEAGLQLGPARAWRIDYYNGVTHKYEFRENNFYAGLQRHFQGPWSVGWGPVLGAGVTLLNGSLAVSRPSNDNLDLPGSAVDSSLSTTSLFGFGALDLERPFSDRWSTTLRLGYRLSAPAIDQKALMPDQPFPQNRFIVPNGGPFALVGIRFGF